MGWHRVMLAALLWTGVAAGADPAQGPHGEALEILPAPTHGAIPFHTKTITINAASLKDGWVGNTRCLDNFQWWGDAVQIVFGQCKIRRIHPYRGRCQGLGGRQYRAARRHRQPPAAVPDQPQPDL